MKIHLLSLVSAALSLLASISAAAQVPNGTLDTWITRNAQEVPQDWSTIDEAIKSSPFGGFYNTVTTAKDPGSHIGAFAARMETKLDPFFALECVDSE